GGDVLLLVAERALAAFADDVGGLRDAEHIENQRDAAVAHDRGTREGLDAFELFAERFYYDLFRVVDLVHDEAELALVGLKHHDVDRREFRKIGSLIFDFQFTIEIDEREEPSAQAVHRDALNQLDALLRVFAVEPDELEQADLWNGIAVTAAGDDQRGNDR